MRQNAVVASNVSPAKSNAISWAIVAGSSSCRFRDWKQKMAILIDSNQRVVVQGITGREGTTRTRLMKDYGTQVVAGVTPGKGGGQVEAVPVYDTVFEARETVGDIDISVLFIPAPLVRSAALEALAAGVKLLVIVPDRVPLYDVLEIDAEARQVGAIFVGPNTLGVLSPDKGVLGMIGGRAESAREWFYPGPVGITSRSGGMTSSTAYYLAKAGMGLSTLVHVGGDAIVGMPHPEVLRRFQADTQTELVVLFGEIGTSQEEEAAALVQSGGFTKPLIAYISGKAAKSGTRFSHAGAIIEGEHGAYTTKVERLREAGVTLVESFSDIPRAAAKLLGLDKSYSIPPAKGKGIGEDNMHWKTAITQIKPNEIRLRGYRLDELMGSITVSQAIFLALTGELPTPEVGCLLDAILVSSIDHGASPPSTLAARTAASTGAPLNAALAAGLLSINQYHGGAIEDCMRMIQQVLVMCDEGKSREEAALALVRTYKSEKKRLPGFGHRIHTSDPRTRRLLELGESTGIADQGVAVLKVLEQELAKRGKLLPANVDGAIAALLVDLKLPPELANAFFMISRLPGLVAQVYEEKTRERPMRPIHPSDHAYDGTPPRTFSGG
jgi:succinyl-CoA synthetase alpha subunit